MDKRFLAILVLIVVVFAGIFVATQSGNGNSSGTGKPTNHVQGQNQKGVTLVEYGDYQCPVCFEYYAPVKQVVDKYNKDIKFQFKNLPLIQLHKNAFAGARAAEAAGLQGKYWQMHDKLYENQDPSGQSGWVVSSDPLNQYFVGYAKDLGLNVSQFKQDYASGKVNRAINADLAEFDKTGQDKATPTFFLNGKYLPNEQLAAIGSNGQLDLQATINNFSKAIDKAISEKSKQ